MKFLVLICILAYSLFASIEFKETRYIAALDFDKEKNGSLEIQKDILILKYTKPNIETITYTDTKVTILNEDNELKEYTFKEYPQAQYMGLIIKAIISENYASMDAMFTMTKEDENVILTSLPVISNHIEYIEIKNRKSNKKIIILYMTNEDKVTIETLN